MRLLSMEQKCKKKKVKKYKINNGRDRFGVEEKRRRGRGLETDTHKVKLISENNDGLMDRLG